MSVVIAWIEYGEWERKKGMKRNHILDLISFREEFDQTLCKAELSQIASHEDRAFKVYSSTVPSPRKKRHQSFTLLVIYVMTSLIIGLKQLK